MPCPEVLKYDPANFRPLHIVAHLITPVITDQFLPLDAVIYYHFVRAHFGARDYSLPNRSNVRAYANIQLPFRKKQVKSDSWFYGASFAVWEEPYVDDNSFFTKRFDQNRSDLIDFQGRRGRIDNQRGRYKSGLFDLYYRHALRVHWWADGDPEAIERILRFVTHLGKKSSQGWGRVRKWEVQEWSEDWSVRGPNNRIMRAIPSHSGKYVYGIRPSYWNQRHQFPCLLPLSPFPSAVIR